MSTTRPHHRRRAARPFARLGAQCVAALAFLLLASVTARAQAAGSTAPAHPAPAAPNAIPLGGIPDLQGIWDFTMLVGARKSTGFFALGPIEHGWAGSLTPDSTNTLAIRLLTVQGDSFRMVVASREGDVPFTGRLSADASVMEGIVEYHGGALLPMTATRRVRRAAPR